MKGERDFFWRKCSGRGVEWSLYWYGSLGQCKLLQQSSVEEISRNYNSLWNNFVIKTI